MSVQTEGSSCEVGLSNQSIIAIVTPVVTVKKHEPILIDVSGASSGDRSHESLHSEYQFLAEQSRHGVWRLDAYGRIVEVNSQMSKWLDTSGVMLLGRRATEFVVSTGSRNPRLMRSGKFDSEFRTATGIARPAEVHSLVLRDDTGKTVGALQVVYDRQPSSELESRLAEEVERMAKLAQEDPVTGLPNRRAFDAALEVAFAKADQEQFGLIMIDLDRFKEINDSLGHAIGDLALVAFGEQLRASVRDVDMVARIGGDEFAVILSGSDVTATEEAALRISGRLNFTALLDGRAVDLHASCGTSHRSLHLEEMMLRSDRAMYATKRRRSRHFFRQGNQKRSSA